MLDVNAHRNHIDETMVDEFHHIVASHPCWWGCGKPVIEGTDDLHKRLCPTFQRPQAPSFAIKMRGGWGPNQRFGMDQVGYFDQER